MILKIKNREEQLIHTKQGHILELLDEDIQEVNLMKSKLLSKNNNESIINQMAMKVTNNSEQAQSNEKESFGANYDDLTADSNSKAHSNQEFGEASLDNANNSGRDECRAEFTSDGKAIEKLTLDKSNFRNYINACDRVRLFYKEQHEKQTFAYNIQARINFKTKVRAKLTIWNALIKLSKLIDESDPDTELSQIEHALQTAEAIRKDNKPRWMQLVGLIHDLGKLLYFFDAKGQWDVVGDTFPVGCAFSKKIVFSEFFKNNKDFHHPIYRTKYGIYSPNCGLDNIMLSWGHDEYMYHVAKLHSTLPKEGLAMIRYHSCYPIHRENAYSYLMNDEDKKVIQAVQEFNPYDLYSKSSTVCQIEKLQSYYQDLIDEFFPNKLVDF